MPTFNSGQGFWALPTGYLHFQLTIEGWGAGGNGGAGDGQYAGGGGSYWIGTTISSQTGGNRSNGYVTITKV